MGKRQVKRMLRDLSRKNRSYTAFNQSIPIPYDMLETMVDCARYAPSGSNIQPLRYLICCTERKNQLVFSHIHWSVLLRGYDGPADGQRPMAYIVILADRGIAPEGDLLWADIGISAQTMMLAAIEMGFGGCMVTDFDRVALASSLELEAWYEPMMILALGKPNERIFLDKVTGGEDTAFYRDKEGCLHIPKRKLCDIILP